MIIALLILHELMCDMISKKAQPAHSAMLILLLKVADEYVFDTAQRDAHDKFIQILN